MSGPSFVEVVSAHLQATGRAPEIGFRRYIISDTTPFAREDLTAGRLISPEPPTARDRPGHQECSIAAGENASRSWRPLEAVR